MKLRRVFTLLLALLMLASPLTEVLPAIVYAEETQQETTVPETTEAPTEAPVETTEAATEAPVETTEAATEAPVETTEAPVETTEAPEETTGATEAPVETTEAPEETTEATEATEVPEETEAEEDNTILTADEEIIHWIEIFTPDDGSYSWAAMEWETHKSVDGFIIYEKAPGQTKFTALDYVPADQYGAGQHYRYEIRFWEKGYPYPSGKYQYTVAPYVVENGVQQELKRSKTVSAIQICEPNIWAYTDGTNGNNISVGYTVPAIGGKGNVQIERCTNYTKDADPATLKWTKIKTITAGKNGVRNFLNDTKANVSGKLYQYRARLTMTIDGKTYQSYYAYTTALHLAKPVVSVKKVNDGFKLSWDRIAGAEEYILNVHYNINGQNIDDEIIIPATDDATMTYLDTNATAPGFYGYQVQARAIDPEWTPDWSQISYATSWFSNHKAAIILKTPEIQFIQNTPKGVELAWDWVDYASKYEIWRSTDGVKFTKIKTVNQNTYFHDTTANKTGKTYTYKIRALAKESAGTFYSEYSETKSIVKLAAPVIKNVKKLTKGGYSVTFGKAANAEYYEIHYWADGDEYKEPTIVKQFKAKTYTVKDPDATKENVIYEYEIIAKNDKTNGSATAFTAAINYGDTDFTLQNTTSGIRIQSEAPAASHYSIYKKVGNGAFKLLKKVAVNMYTGNLDFVDKAVTEGNTYSYKLQPISNYVGAYRTRQSSAQSILRIGAPTLNAPENKDNGILLTWKPNANSPAVKEYRIWRADDEWGYTQVNDTHIATVDGNVTEYLDPIVNFREPGLAYRIEALLEDGSVVASLTKVTFRMPTPIIRESHKITTNMANVIWEGEGYANGNQIRLVNKSTGQSRIVTNTDGWGYAEVSGLVAGVTYEISVRHFNNYAGNRIYSAWSAPFTLNG